MAEDGKSWKEYFIELIGDYDMRDRGIGTVGLKVRVKGVLNKYGREESITEEMKRAVMHLQNGKAGVVNRMASETVKSGGKFLLNVIEKWVWQ